MQQTLVLSSKKQEVINDLNEILEFGFDVISSNTFKMDMKPKKSILLSMMGAVHSYASGILCLLREARTDAAEVLLRSLVESFINLNYVYLDRKQQNAIKFLMSDEYDRKALGKRIANYLKNNPDTKSESKELIDITQWKLFLKERQKSIDELIDKYPYAEKQLPGLRQRAVIVDNFNKKILKGKQLLKLEWWYLMIYWLLSTITHLTPRGLNAFFYKDAYGKDVVNVSGKPNNIQRVGVTTFIIYYSFLRLFAIKFNLFKLDRISKFRFRIKYYSRNDG